MTEPTREEQEDEEAQLLKRLAEVRAAKQAKEQYQSDWSTAIEMDNKINQEVAARNKLIVLDGFSIIKDRLHFKVSDLRDDVTQTIKFHRSTVRDIIADDWHMDVLEWTALKQKLAQLQRVSINLDQSLIDNWKPLPDYKIEKDHKRLILTPGPRAATYSPRTIPGIEWDNRKLCFYVPLPEAWRIPDKLREYQNLEYTEEAKAYVQNQIEKRAELDQIAEREHPTQEYFLKDGIKLRDFQGVTVEFVEAAGCKTLIGHEMGLGKTPCAFSALERIAERGEGSKFLIIVPASLKPNWYRESKKFTGFAPYELTGEKPSPYDTAQVMAGKQRYYIINYDLIGTVTKIAEHYETGDKGEKIRVPESHHFLWVDILNAGNFDAVVIDEAHYIKNVGSNRSRAVRELTIPRVLLLTGTPLLNRPTELWPLIHMLDKEMAGPYESFVKHYTLDGRTPRNVEELREILRPLMFRRTKKDVLKELPPIQRIIRDVELSPQARKNYELVLDGLWAGVKGWSGDPRDSQAITSILAQLMRMKQVAAYDKVEYIADLATELYDQHTNGHKKVLIFSQFVNNPAVVREIANRLAPESLWFSGEHNPMERQQMVDRFQEDDSIHFLVAGLKSAREGLNITAAGSVIFADLDWTPANHHQAEARAYGRLSDLHSIDSYYILADNTIEHDIWGLLEAKLNIFNAVIEGTEELRDASVVMELLKILKERA